MFKTIEVRFNVSEWDDINRLRLYASFIYNLSLKFVCRHFGVETKSLYELHLMIDQLWAEEWLYE